MIELLAPAQSLETAEAAVSHGADALYAGLGQFNLRAHAPSFTISELPELINLAHSHKKRIYLTLNILPNDEQLSDIETTLKELTRLQNFPDALIVADPGVLTLCRSIVPGVEFHLSTQTGTFNCADIRFWKDQGVSRIILPRELSLDQITIINQQSILPTELFIHGAMCVSIAGRCLLGAYLNGRHPNAGDCPQPCRLRYNIIPIGTDNNPGQPLTIEEGHDTAYILNSKDLNTLSILPQILSSGVSSLKIEGRNKSLHYVCSVVKTYRAALDSALADPINYIVKDEWQQELDQLDHRPYTTGFYQMDNVMQSPFVGKNHSKIRVVGVVREVMADTRYIIDVKNPFTISENISVLPQKTGISPFTVSFTSLTDIRGVIVGRALTNRLIVGTSDVPLHPGDVLRRIH